MFNMSNTKYPVLYRTYSRNLDGRKESEKEIWERVKKGLFKKGNFSKEEEELISTYFDKGYVYPSGRYMWVGGTEFSEKEPLGTYNCTSVRLVDIDTFRLSFNLSMLGCGVGNCFELEDIALFNQKYPVINCSVVKEFYITDLSEKWNNGNYCEKTRIDFSPNKSGSYDATIVVGDTREGWAEGVKLLIDLFRRKNLIVDKLVIDLGFIRPKGTPIKGFGGIANPVYVPTMFKNIITALQEYHQKPFDAFLIEKIFDEQALSAVSGNIRRSARISQGSPSDEVFTALKQDLWVQDENGWRIDPKRDCFRMANHTVVFHSIPTKEDWKKSLTSQFRTGEGALEFAPMAVLRGNIDLLSGENRTEYLKRMEEGTHYEFLKTLALEKGETEEEVEHRLKRYEANPCFEILGSNLVCNLGEVQLNTLWNSSEEEIKDAFRVTTLMTASLLKDKFSEPVLQKSRELDPIIGVSITGLFDYFVQKLGEDYLIWWVEGRSDENPNAERFSTYEKECLTQWKEVVDQTLTEYCLRQGLRKPNRFTCIKPSGTLSLLSDASPGWHPPKYWQYVRRITFGANDPIALACLEYGFSIVPSQSCTDEEGRLLDDPFSPRVTEWLVQIPVRVPYFDLVKLTQEKLGFDFDADSFSGVSQLKFYHIVNKYWSTHTTSATVEFRENEIEEMADYMVNNQVDMEYVSFATLPRFDSISAYPRMPFEPISDEQYIEMESKIQRHLDFYELVSKYYSDESNFSSYRGVAQCDSGLCELKGAGYERN